MKNNQELVEFVKTHYHLEILQVAKLTDKVFKLEAPAQEYLLKFTSGEPDFLMNQLYANKELPENVLPVYETQSATLTVPVANGFAYLTDYVGQIPMPFENRVRDYATLLGKLHAATEIVVDKNDDEISWMYHDDYQRLADNFTTLKTLVKQYELKISRSPFEWQILMMYPLLYGMFWRSDAALKKFYQLLSQKKKLPVALVHVDVNVANVLPNAKASKLINFEHSSFDIPSQDMLKFISHYHQSGGVAKIITDYLNSQTNKLVVHSFFMKSLCVDLKGLVASFSQNSLIDISLLNEKIAVSLMAMQIYDEINAPKKPNKTPKPEKA